jgi:hypothetical protein
MNRIMKNDVRLMAWGPWFWSLPFHAWPWRWRLLSWSVCGVLVTVMVDVGRGGLLSGRGADDMGAEATALGKIRQAERRAATLAGLRQRVTVRNAGAQHGTVAVPHVSAALLAWVEQQAQAAGVLLQGFEPAFNEAGSAARDASDVSAAAVPEALISGTARLTAQSGHGQIVALVERLARTVPLLLIEEASVTAQGAVLLLDLRFGVARGGAFRLSEAQARPRDPAASTSTSATQSSGAANRDGGAALAQRGDAPAGMNPFARRRLPPAVVSARLLGTLSRGTQRVAVLLADGVVTEGAEGDMFGDAQIRRIGVQSITLLPFSGGPARVLRLGE